MARHCTQCRRKDETVTADALRKLGAENRDSFNAACTNMRGSLLFGMRELESKKSYTPYEVAELLRSFGHCAVPLQFERVYKRVPVYNTLTDRRFDTQIRPSVPRVESTILEPTSTWPFLGSYEVLSGKVYWTTQRHG